MLTKQYQQTHGEFSTIPNLIYKRRSTSLIRKEHTHTHSHNYPREIKEQVNNIFDFILKYKGSIKSTINACTHSQYRIQHPFLPIQKYTKKLIYFIQITIPKSTQTALGSRNSEETAKKRNTNPPMMVTVLTDIR